MMLNLGKRIVRPSARAFSSKYDIPTLGEYHSLFNNSSIMEKLMPRELSDGQSMLDAFPSVLKESASSSEVTGDTAHDLTDFQAVNKVSNQ